MYLNQFEYKIFMQKDILKLWMPVTKGKNNSYVGILSDTSIDRDGEFMTGEMLEEWAENSVLPALANHDNRMEMLVGGWKNLKTIKKGKHTALMAEPFFLESNPLAKQIRNMVEESISKGLNIGISIGMIPTETVEKEIDGEKRKGYNKGELIEATWVPLQSNRNAFAAIAKSFDLEVTKPADVERCVDALMADPDFKPKEGKTKEESAWAVCQTRAGKKKKEAITMTEEEQKKKDDMMHDDEEEEEEDKKSSELQEAKQAALQAQEAAKKCTELVEKMVKQLESVTKEVTNIKTKAVNLPRAEGPLINQKQNMEPTVSNMLKGFYTQGGRTQ